MKKYLFEFLAVFLGIIGGFAVEEYRETKNEFEDTKKALSFIYYDMFIDSIEYISRLEQINQDIENLALGIDGKPLTLVEFKRLHKGLRSITNYHLRRYGIDYLTNNIQHPRMQSDSILTLITGYYTNSTETGNFGKWNSYYSEIANESYVKLFESFPNFFSNDTTLANDEIQENLEQFLQSPYWQGRINLAYREKRDLIKPIFEENQYWNTEILRQLRTEIPNYKPHQ
ncbi:MAG: hypothetical protein JXQ90_00765 [Cyclobacteriaceae bacterium]